MADELDRRLLSLLRHNARETTVVLARKLKVSLFKLQNRIARILADRRILLFTLRSPDADESRVRAVMTIAIEGEHSAKVIKA